jgi:Holliday junction resolvasome RuvABC DNA-binding subunit
MSVANAMRRNNAVRHGNAASAAKIQSIGKKDAAEILLEQATHVHTRVSGPRYK